MNKNAKKKAKVSWITVWLIAAVAILSITVTYAAYTRVTTAKRVVSTKKGAGLLFSSNYMTTGGIETRERGDYNSYIDEKGNVLTTNPTYIMSVCNYPQGDKSIWYTSSDISYTLTAEILLNEKYTAEENAGKAGQYKPATPASLRGKKFGIGLRGGAVAYFSDTRLTIPLPTTGTYTLDKTATDYDEFEIIIDKSELQNDEPTMIIKLTAEPVNMVGGELETLTGYIGACKRASSKAEWTGAISDENYTSVDYDAYNYVISGNGSGVFYFAYNSDKVNPNEFFFLNHTGITRDVTPIDWAKYTQYKTAPSGNWKQIEIAVDSDKVPRYEIQLYKTSDADDRDLIDTYVDYAFIPTESE